jgi:hypothetical protein
VRRRPLHHGALGYRTGHGHPYMYDTVWDTMRLVDYLETHDDVDPKRIGP